MSTVKMGLFSLIFWLLAAFTLFANDPVAWTDVRSLGFGAIYAPVYSPVNPASLSLSKQRSLLFSYQNNFLVKQLSALAACYQQPNRWLDFSVLITTFGYDLYRETRCGLNVSKVLKPGFSLGAGIYYYGLHYVGNEDNVSVVSGDIGLQYLPVDNFRIGVLIQNPFRVSYKRGDAEYNLPVCMEIGVEYSLSDACRLMAEVEKDTRFPVCFKGGIAYEVERFLEMRLGVLTSPLMPTAGVGFRFDAFRVDTSVTYHTVLGISPAIAISFYF